MAYFVEALAAPAAGNVKAMVEAFSNEKVAEAYEGTASGKGRFRAVVPHSPVTLSMLSAAFEHALGVGPNHI